MHQLVTFCGGRFHVLVQFLSEENNRKAYFIKYSESPGSIKMTTSTQTYPALGGMAGVTLSGGQGHLWRKAGFTIYPKPRFQNLDPSYRLVKHSTAGSFQVRPGLLPLLPRCEDVRCPHRPSSLLCQDGTPRGWGLHLSCSATSRDPRTVPGPWRTLRSLPGNESIRWCTRWQLLGVLDCGSL